MSAVWRVARAAVARRRLQTIVIGLVVWVAAATVVMALGLLESSAAPFDRAYAQQSGAHLVAEFDRSTVTDAQLTRAAGQPVVAAVAGPYGEVTLDAPLMGSLKTVGRADPGGAVDRLEVWDGRWVAAPGEIVLNRPPGQGDPSRLGDQIAIPGRPVLTVVGFAFSVGGSADAWVTPAQMTTLGPTVTQMLYRFTPAATAADVSAGQAAVTAGLPPGSLLGSLSYLTVREKATSESDVYVPFLMLFGFLGLVVAVLIVANLVSGAVVAGFRHIGILKALGFTPNQVMTVYLLMVSIPSVIGCVLGTVTGNLVTPPVVQDAVEGFGVTDVGIAAWVDVCVLLGMPAVVVLAALVSALRARRLSAAQAISAGSAQRVGRALRIQRWLGGTRLPRPVSLGLGVPFARPARSVLTMAAVVLGVLTVTLAVGVTASVTAYRDAVNPSPPGQVEVLAGSPGGPGRVIVGNAGPDANVAPTLGDSGDESLLRSVPGVVHVAAVSSQDVEVAGGSESTTVQFYRGDSADLAPRVLSGHWPDGPGQVAVPSRFLNQRGLAVGDTITVELHGNRTQLRIVGVVLTNDPDTIFSNWETLALLAPGTRADTYRAQLAPGADRQAFTTAVEAGDPGLQVLPPRDNTSSQAVVIISAATLLTLLLGIVAALGVFNTVVLNAHERRRDLGMLKSIGMTPRQVIAMMVTSMGALGLVGGAIGLPLGLVAHRLLVPAMAHAAQADAPGILLDVYHAPSLTLLALAGIAIAVLGALIPAAGAGRMTIAAALHNE